MKYEMPNKEIIISEYQRLIKNNSFNMTIILINYNYKYLKKDIRKIIKEYNNENFIILESKINKK